MHNLYYFSSDSSGSSEEISTSSGICLITSFSMYLHFYFYHILAFTNYKNIHLKKLEDSICYLHEKQL